ncbi:PREDICTED: putative Dol-P-Glc:Glc(2)Man(9)GlcNAc(2)-PP-Dol alpha-1,2-glucosyltransferase [Polistes canadensis]|uniref:putative Dol-P-Glc:Glc(2)Man(9)GlcNAc(2)-PP-Dol alpha-1,2-glucosyltransferase n=1 Tax=Polistes canadensis TaxID=91411 RepID=UPI000718BDBC|nr:PREDICTED: putative Dol-P-Glc:Glc(2)Man(9)GlcNAc(2)-PP-Dol alpha-1,2-glucosyltransferase [Polistes canadensis]XP_014603003.1 PREDICTED: putative Dol-P-Glc:Glc(2)Man(9)GlcNAc(2)-PP-Dol alpha-1,2-glucosyltransferase [Polistes canadensis]
MILLKFKSESTYYSMYKYALFIIFITSTSSLFIYLNKIQPYYYIDEMFHIPQTLHYCDGNFTVWDSKITTLPGLYFLTAAILSPLNLCSIFYIRCINLFGTFANFYLTYSLMKQIHKNNWEDWMQLEIAYDITMFPPLFFWFFLYYTDVVSVNVVLLMLLLHFQSYYKISAFAGLLSILIRQTNVIWVIFLTLERLVDLIHQYTQKPATSMAINTPIHLKLLWKSIVDEANNGKISFIKFLIKIIINLFPYIMVGIIFLIFLIWNGGIVVGDRTAHVPIIHIPQLFYFSVFLFSFLWPYMIPHCSKFFQSIQDHWILSSFIFALITIIVHCNTLVHPYVLADNRHYTFYIWNKFMGKYFLFRYMLVPVYCFTIYSALYGISHIRFATQINFIFCTAIALVLQLLLEPRYFIIPYIFYRLSMRKPQNWQIVMESFTNLIVNLLQFFIFVNKVFYWEDQVHPQRISW